MAGAGGLGFDDDSDGGASLILSWLRLATCEADDASCARVLRDPLLALRQVRGPATESRYMFDRVMINITRQCDIPYSMTP